MISQTQCMYIVYSKRTQLFVMNTLHFNDRRNFPYCSISFSSIEVQPHMCVSPLQLRDMWQVCILAFKAITSPLALHWAIHPIERGEKLIIIQTNKRNLKFDLV